MSDKLVIVILLLATFGWIVPSAQGISIVSFLLLRQQALSQQQASQTNGNQNTGPRWEEWSQWSMCTSTEGMGVRVRSRKCNGIGNCERLPGDNYELQQCNRRGGDSQNQNSEYLQQCNDDPDMQSTLSCKLYRENPTMAYDIFQSTGCLFNVIGDQTEESEETDSNNPADNLVFGRAPDPRAGEVGLAFQAELDTATLSSGRFTEDGISPRQPQSILSTAANALLTRELCTSACETIVLQASGISRFGANVPTSVSALIRFLSENAIFRDNTDALNDEYRNCLTTCGVTGPVYGALRLSLLNRGQDRALQNSNLEVGLAISSEGTGSQRRRRDTSTASGETATPSIADSKKTEDNETTGPLLIPPGYREQTILLDLLNAALPSQDHGLARDERKRLSGRLITPPTQQSPSNTIDSAYVTARLEGPENKKRSPILSNANTTNNISETHTTAQMNNEENEEESTEATLSRSKRQSPFTPNRYRSPCFVSAQLSSSPRVLTLDDTEGELFFYEGRQQQFLRRRCAGRSIVSDSLYQAQEQVLQARTGQLALCKQGYLRRYGLLIQIDPEGEFAFSDGERFSVKFKPFKLESHCSLSTLL